MNMAKACRVVLYCCAAATAATVTNFANVATVAATTAVVVIKQTIGFV